MSDTRFLRIPPQLAGQRLDRALAQLVPEYSRSRLQQWIREGQVLPDGERTIPRAPVAEGAQVQLQAVVQPLDSPVEAQSIELDLCNPRITSREPEHSKLSLQGRLTSILCVGF